VVVIFMLIESTRLIARRWFESGMERINRMLQIRKRKRMPVLGLKNRLHSNPRLKT
jgi:hypothetical protein